MSALIGIVMGSDSDWPVMEQAARAVSEFDVEYEVDVVSAHRMPREMLAYRGGGGRAWSARDHRRCRGSGAPAGNAGKRHAAAGHR